jgi:tetratricopeptide (TPR) repeat protein
LAVLVILCAGGRAGCLAFVTVNVVIVQRTWGTWWLLLPMTVVAIVAGVRCLGHLRADSTTPPQEALRHRIVKLLGPRGRPRGLSKLRRAITLLRSGIDAVPPGHPERTWYLAALGTALQTMAVRRMDSPAEREAVPLLQEAVRFGREAVAAGPSDHPGRAERLGDLALSLVLLFGLLRSSDDHKTTVLDEDLDLLEEAVRAGRECVAAAPPDDPNRAGYLTNFGTALMVLFALRRDPSVLEEAIAVARDSVTATLPEDPDPSGYLTTLSVCLQIKFKAGGDLRALEEAVHAARQAVAAASPTGLDQSANLANLSAALHLLYVRRPEPDALEELVEVSRKALARVPRSHPNRTLLLLNLGAGFRTVATTGGNPAVLDDAVRACRRALAASPPGHPYRVRCLLSLGGTLQSVSERDKNPAPLTRGIQLCREALSIASDASFDSERSHCMAALGDLLRSRFEQCEDPGDLEEARHLFASVATATASASSRLSAAVRAADLDLLTGDHDHALVMAELAVELLPRITSRRIGQADRRHLVVGFAGLASTVAAAAAAAGAPDRAVELLEQTRGVVLADTFDTRGDLTQLREQAPDLVGEFDDLRRAIEEADHTVDEFDPLPGNGPIGTGDLGRQVQEDLAGRRAILDRRWTGLLQRIRLLPQLEDFLLPPPIGQLRRQAAEGPIVYVVPHRQRGLALTVTHDEDRPVQMIALPAFTQQAAAEQVKLLGEAQRSASDADLPADERRAAQQRVLRVLGWLWDSVTEPVLRHLGHTAPPLDGSTWPRVWWCPVGISALLPLHAAGHHTTSSATVMDRVVSSYTPTIRALGHARAPRTRGGGLRPATSHTSSMTIVAVPDAPGSPPLVGVTREVGLLREMFPLATLLPSPGDAVNRDDVIAALPKRNIAHFACHGLADLLNPADSRLLLHDHEEQPFTVAAIARLRLDHGELAFLSACSTTESHPRHADEATHLTAAFQLAGYRAVIGTLWPVNDHAAPLITQGFYARLTRNGAAPPDPAAAALALHNAIRHHRAQRPAVPTQWAAYVHSGR